MKKIFLLSSGLAMILLLGGCSLYGNTTTPVKPVPTPVVPSQPQDNAVTNTPSANNPPPEAIPVNQTVSIQNFAFNPSPITIKKGATVTWTNNDSALHQLKSDTFNSNSLAKGQTFSFTFNSVGSFDYICSLHPSMKGKIIVE